ncbi:AraC family transcriptional regulator [Paraburkholderia oxyphila]|uniref:AraC family transcriptional regulator n=1 Tax=Paraburkholderia oxyphila TaxID=614212 RepID=UPI0005BD0831|nr:AraC family transcriptional regulator [Paraburkholderia oxyphila]
MATVQRNPVTANEPKARAAALTHYLQVALRHGLPAHDLMRKFGLDPAMLMNREQRIPFLAVCRLLEASASESGCMSFGIQMARARTAFDFGVIGLLLAHKRTLREVLLAMLQYRHLLNDALGLYFETTGSRVVIGEQILCDTGEWPRQTVELAIGVLTRTCAAILGPNWKPVSVHFTHSAPADLRDHRHYFGCPVIFGSEFNGLVCVESDLDQPNPMADPELVRYAEGLAKSVDPEGSPTIDAEVRNAIYLLLPVEQADIESVARQLHTSVRTLQRHLSDADTTFSDLIEEVRHDLAVRYMSNRRYSIGRVSALLGYTRHASFTQWFTRHFGMAPKAWRNAHCK